MIILAQDSPEASIGHPASYGARRFSKLGSSEAMSRLEPASGTKDSCNSYRDENRIERHLVVMSIYEQRLISGLSLRYGIPRKNCLRL